MATRQMSGSSAVSTQSTGLWDLAVPPEEVETQLNSKPYLSSPPRQPLASYSNGNTLPRAPSRSKQTLASDRQPTTEMTLKPPQRIRLDTSDTGSNAYSLVDLYRASRESLTQPGLHDQQQVKRKTSHGAASALNASAQMKDDPDKWIHRDKLQQIEIREMMEEGRRLDLPVRSSSRTDLKATQPDLNIDDSEIADNEDFSDYRDMKRQRVSSPVLSSQVLPNGNHRIVDHEGAASRESNNQDPYRARRTSVSRIPVSKTSPSMAGASAKSRYDSVKRPRTGSQGSQNMLDTVNREDTQTPTSPTSAQSSPEKSMLNSKTLTPSKGARSVSRGTRGALGQARPGTGTSPRTGAPSRPGTSSGRPSTARPEGDPPWIDSMFKPDPRIPPDQQMLPTHAKRLAEQQFLSEADAYANQRNNMANDGYDLSPNSGNPGMGSTEAQRVDARNEYIESMRATHSSSQQNGHNTHLQVNTQDTADSQYNNSWNLQAPNSPSLNENSRESGHWPLRTLSFNKYAPEQPAVQMLPDSDAGSRTSRQQTRLSTNSSAGYSLMPSIQGQREMEQRASTLSPIPQQSYSHYQTQPVRVPEDPEPSEKQKKKGCAGCCIVM